MRNLHKPGRPRPKAISIQPMRGYTYNQVQKDLSLTAGGLNYYIQDVPGARIVIYRSFGKCDPKDY